jgi:xanthosine utilization system XapX-like protein
LEFTTAWTSSTKAALRAGLALSLVVALVPPALSPSSSEAFAQLGLLGIQVGQQGGPFELVRAAAVEGLEEAVDLFADGTGVLVTDR